MQDYPQFVQPVENFQAQMGDKQKNVFNLFSSSEVGKTCIWTNLGIRSGKAGNNVLPLSYNVNILIIFIYIFTY